MVKGKVNEYSFFIVWFVDSYLRKNSWLSHFKFWSMVVEKGSSGWRGITSSIYLNWNISVINCRFGIKLNSVKEELSWLLVRKKALFYVTSSLADMTSLKFHLWIFLLFFVRLSHNLVREIWVVHMTLRSYKIPCDLLGWHLGSMARVMHILSFLFDLSIHNFANSWQSHFKLSFLVVDKRLPNHYVINIFKLEYLHYLLSVCDQTYFSNSRMTITFSS